MPYFRRSAAMALQRRFRQRRINYMMLRARRSFRMTPNRYRAVRRVPTWYFRYGRYRRLRY